MPVKVVKNLPAIKELSKENIFVMDEGRAENQDIRPLQILIVNLMPTKQVTEEQILRLLANSPLQINATFLRMATHQSKNVSQEHLEKFYTTFDQVEEDFFDGMIITGAPVEHLDYEEVNYWEELASIMDWAKTHVFAELLICWGAQAGLYHDYGIEKYPLDEKLFGIFEQNLLESTVEVLRGFDEVFKMPHSRHTDIHPEDIEAVDDLEILVDGPETGVSIIQRKDGRTVYVTGHLEYDAETLGLEYQRDIDKGLNIKVPQNYYPDNDPSKTPPLTWRAHANLLLTNWLNYHVYQRTPYKLEDIENNHS